MENINIKQETAHFVENASIQLNEAIHQPDLSLRQQLDVETKRNTELNLELEKIKQNESEQQENMVKKNDEVKIWKLKFETVSQENYILKKRVHELEQICQKRSIISDVSAILGHEKRFVGQMYYRIRQKDSSDDIWQAESNLECANLLNPYKKDNRIQN